MLTNTKDGLKLDSPEISVTKGTLALRPETSAPSPQAPAPQIPAPQKNLKAPGPDAPFIDPSQQKSPVIGSPAIFAAPALTANSVPAFRGRFTGLNPVAVHAAAPGQPAPGPNPLHRYARMAHHHYERKNMRNYKHVLKDIFGPNLPGQKPHAKPENGKKPGAKQNAAAPDSPANTTFYRVETKFGTGTGMRQKNGQQVSQEPSVLNIKGNAKGVELSAMKQGSPQAAAALRPAGRSFAPTLG